MWASSGIVGSAIVWLAGLGRQLSCSPSSRLCRMLGTNLIGGRSWGGGGYSFPVNHLFPFSFPRQ